MVMNQKNHSKYNKKERSSKKQFDESQMRHFKDGNVTNESTISSQSGEILKEKSESAAADVESLSECREVNSSTSQKLFFSSSKFHKHSFDDDAIERSNHVGGVLRPDRSAAENVPRRAEPNSTFTNDTKFSKLVRRVIKTDSDHERRIYSCKELYDYVQHPLNKKALGKVWENLVNMLAKLFHDSKLSLEVKHEASRCIGSVGHSLGYDLNFLKWIFDRYNDCVAEEMRILLLEALLETLLLDKKAAGADEFSVFVMSNIQVVLENAESAVLLRSIVDVIVHISKHYPNIFSSHFKDTVDILIGWHIDPTLDEGMATFTSDTLVSLNRFWIADSHFSVTLLGQFLEDLEAYIEELKSVEDISEIDTSDECYLKLVSLIRVFTTVIRSLGEASGTSTNSFLTTEFHSRSLEVVLRCITEMSKLVTSTDSFLYANTAMTVLVASVGSHLAPHIDAIIAYVELQSDEMLSQSTPYIFSLLSLVNEVIQCASTQLPIATIPKILGPTSKFCSMKMSTSTKVQKIYMKIYHNLLSVKNIPLLEEIYRYILGDVQTAWKVLVRDVPNFVEDNPWRDVIYSPRDAELTAIFNVCALSEIGNVKNSIIGMLALKPSFFELLTTYLDPTRKELFIKYPMVHHALTFTLYSHCIRYNHYIGNSNLISSSSSNGNSCSTPSTPVIVSGNCSPIMSSSTTSGHLGTIINILTELMKLNSTPLDCRLLCMKWATDFISTICSQPWNLMLLFRASAFTTLIEVLSDQLFSLNSSVFSSSSHILAELISASVANIPSTVFKKCYEACILRLSSINCTVQDACIRLLSMIPLNFSSIDHVEVTNKINVVMYQKKQRASCDTILPANNFRNIWTARRCHILSGPTGTFHTHNFKMVMSFLVNSFPARDHEYLKGVFYSCQRSEKNLTSEDRLMGHFCSNNRSTIWFWAVWEAAQFCVLSKLRTPFGKPHETFTAVEMAMKNYAKEASNVETVGGVEERGKSKLDNNVNNSAKVILLLHFVDNLERLMYNAYEGCAVAMTATPKLVKTFFRTNKATCQEWIRRMRHAIVVVALNAGQNAIAVQQGYQLLHEMVNSGKHNGDDFEKALIFVCRALVALKATEPILGLYHWCKEKLGRKFTWLKAAVDEAGGRYEAAIYEYTCIMHSEDKIATDDTMSAGENHSDKENVEDANKFLHSEDSYLHSFLEKQICECYCKLSCWSDLVKWKEGQLQETRVHNSAGILHRSAKNHNLDYIRALSSFESYTTGSAYYHNSKYDAVFFNSPEGVSWNGNYLIQKAERALMAATLNFETVQKYGSDDTKQIASQAQKACDLLTEDLRNKSLSWPPDACSETMATLQCASAIKELVVGDNVINPISVTDIASAAIDKNGAIYNKALFWIGVWHRIASKQHDPTIFHKYIGDIQLLAARIARKHQNDKLSQKILLDHSNMAIGGRGIQSATLINMLCVYNQQPTSESVLGVQREGSKLLRSLNDTENAVEMLSHSILNAFQAFNMNNNEYQLSSQEVNKCKQMNARSFVTLAKWLQHDSVVQSLLVSTEENNAAATILKYVVNLAPSIPLSSVDPNDIEAYEVRPQDCGSVDHIESFVGHTYHLAITQCPTLAKSWFNFANWCYKWGRKTVDNVSEEAIVLQEEERQKIMDILPKEMGEEEMEIVFTIVSQIHVNIGGEWTDLDRDIDYRGNDGSENTRQRLISSCPALVTMDNDSVEQLVDIWRCVQNRAYNFYVLSAKSYFKYLQLNGIKASPCHDNNVSEDGNITATLRLLRLLAKHASELRDVLEKGLATTPTVPWKGIIPQLFSRLNHPEPYVRQSISDLLCRIAQDSPDLIIFPAVVGSSSVTASDENLPSAEICYRNAPELFQGKEESESEEASPQSEKAHVMQNSFSAMVDTLAKRNMQTIDQVKSFVSELRRITLLWDELWLGTLTQHQADINRKVNQLESEVQKVRSNPNLSQEEKEIIIREKHKTILKPLLFILEHLQKITSQSAETPHERSFQDRFSKLISETLANMRDPPDPSKPHLTWNAYKLLIQTLQQVVQKRVSRVNSLKMAQISPKLASMASTTIAMPGVGRSESEIVTITGVHDVVSILPTKTKPKKLVFFGSDGKKHTYLFKGIEDLHLDERIMQFLNIVNNMFAKTRHYSKELYHARNYSVTPLGPRSGLIQWVDGATAIFGLYKRWQHREAAAQNTKNQDGSEVATVTRPSEIFYKKLTPMLKEKGITNLDNRKEWPMSILKQVLQELMKDTPNDLLAKEMWCSCSSANEWWNVTQTYGQSTAVISIIGYIIGLGDRHLDNVLVDFATGEVVHIDYNVCFEKGKNLRVPEKVPFRMTPNIRTALGVTGVEGTFRVSCEHVLKTLRKGKETLLTLLEAFVYDPLVDWTPGGTDGGYAGALYGGGNANVAANNNYKCERLNMEREIAYNMLAMRIAEMKTDWLNNKVELEQNILSLKTVSTDWVEEKKKFAAIESSVESLKQQIKYVETIRKIDDHSITNLSKRYSEYQVVKEAMDGTKAAIDDRLQECSRWQRSHETSLTKLDEQTLLGWLNVLSANSKNLDCFDLVTDFLLSAGQSQLLSQCEQVENDAKISLDKQLNGSKNLLQVLLTYSSIVNQFSKSFAEQNRNGLCEKLLRNLADELSSAKCRGIGEEYSMAYGPNRLSLVSIQRTIQIQYQLHAYVASLNANLLELLSKSQVENPAYLEFIRDNLVQNIQDFLDTNKGSTERSTFLSVILKSFGNLNKKLLMTEVAAGAAGSHVVDLTSLEGEWFFNDVHSMSSNAVGFAKLVEPLLQNENSKLVLESVNAIHQVIDSIQELSSKFKEDVLPVVTKLIQIEDEDMLKVIKAIEEIVGSVDMSLNSLISQIESHIRCIILDMESPYERAITLVSEIKNNYELFAAKIFKSEESTSGFSCFTTFDQLFCNLRSKFSNLLSKYNLLILPPSWRKLDSIREAKSLQAPISMKRAQELLDDIFMLKRLKTINQVFYVCKLRAEYFYSNLDKADKFGTKDSYGTDAIPYTGDAIYQPIKIFVSDFIGKQLLGVPSEIIGYAVCILIDELKFIDLNAEIEQKDVGAHSKVCLDDLVMKTNHLRSKEELVSPAADNQIEEFVFNLDAVWKNLHSNRSRQRIIDWLKSCLECEQKMLTSHQWLYEDHLVTGNPKSAQNFSSPIRSTVMSDTKKAVQALASTDSSLSTNRERFVQLVASVEQRLKWAAGANPSLSLVLSQFENNVADKKEELNVVCKISKELISVANGILHFEAHRTLTNEATNYDKSFLQFIKYCSVSCISAEKSNVTVTPVEENLLTNMPLKNGEKISDDWVSHVKVGLQQLLKKADEEAETGAVSLLSKTDCLKQQVMRIRNILSNQHRHMSEIRNVLKTLAKHEDMDENQNENGATIKAYTTNYKKFSEEMSGVIRDLLSEENLKVEFVSEAVKKCEILLEEIQKGRIYEDLVSLGHPLANISNKYSDASWKKNMGAVALEGTGSCTSPIKMLGGVVNTNTVASNSPSDKQTSSFRKVSAVARDPRTGKAMQERNIYAMNVWKRVKMKLDGRDPDSTHRMSVAEQVDYSINEATSLDNLAVLYEGWTPWV